MNICVEYMRKYIHNNGNMLYLITKFYKYGQYFCSLYLFIKNKDTKYCNKYLNYLDKHIYNCGPIGVKLIQFLIMYDNIVSTTLQEKLKYVLDDCKVHSWDTTKDLYYTNFKRNIDDDYEIDINNITNDTTVIGSGSIAQVYKLYNKSLQKYVAVKVKHPHIDEEIDFFVNIITFFMNVINTFITLPYKSVISTFNNNIQIQKNFFTEANNLNQLRYNFKEETHIIIPEVYEANNDFIVMSYHEGIDITEVDKSLKYAISQDINYFILTSILIHDFIHADLHNGNWKIQLLDNNKYNIVIYDCGLVISTNNMKLNKDIIFTIMTVEYKKFVDIFTRYVPNNTNTIVQTKNTINTKYIQYIESIILDTSIIQAEKVIKILKYGLDLNIITDYSAINLILSSIMSCSIQLVSANKLHKIINLPNDTIDTSITFIINIEILRRMDKYKVLYIYFNNYISNNPTHEEDFNTWLYDNFGHTDKDILFNIIAKYNFL